MSDTKLAIWTYTVESDVKSALPKLGGGRGQLQVTEVDARAVADNLKRVIAEFDAAIPGQLPGGFDIDSIELHFGVNANGSVALLAKVEAGVEASIKVTLKRSRRD